MFRSALLVCTILTATNTHAEGQYKTFGAGVKSCGDFVKSKGSMRNLYVQWILGFLTAMDVRDVVASGKDSAMPLEASVNAYELWMDNYCKGHALESVANAAINLYFEVKKK